jgi:hypothetical protein
MEAFPDDPDHNVSSDMIERKLRVQPDLFLVAVADDVVVGTVLAGFDGVRGWLHRLAVRASARPRVAAVWALASSGVPKPDWRRSAARR